MEVDSQACVSTSTVTCDAATEVSDIKVSLTVIFFTVLASIDHEGNSIP